MCAPLLPLFREEVSLERATPKHGCQTWLHTGCAASVDADRQSFCCTGASYERDAGLIDGQLPCGSVSWAQRLTGPGSRWRSVSRTCFAPVVESRRQSQTVAPGSHTGAKATAKATAKAKAKARETARQSVALARPKVAGMGASLALARR